MTITSSGAITFDALRTEFFGSGNTNPISLGDLNRGGGEVASHWNNTSIPTTDSNLQASNFYGSGINYKTTITSGVSGASAGYISGTIGSITAGTSQIGLSYSNTLNGTLQAFYSVEQTPPKGGGPITWRLNLQISGGDFTSSTWNYLDCNGDQYTRASANTVQYLSNTYTQWTWIGLATAPTVNGSFYLVL